MARRPRLAAQAAAASMKLPMPQISDNEDDDMADAPTTEAPTPRDDEDENEDQDDDNDGEGDDGDGDGEENDDQNDVDEDVTNSRVLSRSATPRRARGRLSLGGRRRKPGRPPKNRVLTGASDDEGQEGGSDAGTPKRRGGFRGHRGGRWGKAKGSSARAAPAPLDDDGNVLEVLDDEIVLPEDPEGEQKVDKNGYLKDGREYRVRTFTVVDRDERLYMLSTEPARCIGFRDSYLFFQKHKHLFKIITNDEEKRDLIERDLMPHSYKGRAIGIVTARSVFREFGAKIIIGGKKVVDDYDVQGARERGDVEGELAVPEDRLPTAGDLYNRNQYVAWHGASAVYHTNLPNAPVMVGKGAEPKRKRVLITSDNWKFEHAREASRFNSMLSYARLGNANGSYDIHTNVLQTPSSLQPTHVRWSLIDDKAVDDDNDDGNNGEEMNNHSHTQKLAKLDPVYGRNFQIQDLWLESAPDSTMPAPNLDSKVQTLSNVPVNILEELPPTCRQAFENAKTRELDWLSSWSAESNTCFRAHFVPSVEWYPK